MYMYMTLYEHRGTRTYNVLQCCTWLSVLRPQNLSSAVWPRPYAVLASACAG
eukprot:COSAG04_NODE_8917_length_917_cov_1.458435_1_plen_51_part_10